MESGPSALTSRSDISGHRPGRQGCPNDGAAETARKIPQRQPAKNGGCEKMISHFFTRPFYIESAAQKRKDLREFRRMLIFPRG